MRGEWGGEATGGFHITHKLDPTHTLPFPPTRTVQGSELLAVFASPFVEQYAGEKLGAPPAAAGATAPGAATATRSEPRAGAAAAAGGLGLLVGVLLGVGGSCALRRCNGRCGRWQAAGLVVCARGGDGWPGSGAGYSAIGASPAPSASLPTLNWPC